MKKKSLKVIIAVALVIVISICIGIGISIGGNLFIKKENISNSNEEIVVENENKNNEQEDNSKDRTSTNEKQYYDFIDSEYGTFNFTEEEIVNRIMRITGTGQGYIEQGYEKTKSTEYDRTNIYSKVVGSSINAIYITTSSTNEKVISIKMHISGIFTEEQTKNNMEISILNIVGGILNYQQSDVNDSVKNAECKKLADELLNNNSINKGLKLNCDWEHIGQTRTGSNVEVIVVKGNNEEIIDNKTEDTTPILTQELSDRIDKLRDDKTMSKYDDVVNLIGFEGTVVSDNTISQYEWKDIIGNKIIVFFYPDGSVMDAMFQKAK